MKDKTFYLTIDGSVTRIRAPKKPDNETMKAIEALVKVVKMKKKPTHGGKRKNSGRNKLEKTKVMRIPVSLVTFVEDLIKDYNEFSHPSP